MLAMTGVTANMEFAELMPSEVTTVMLLLPAVTMLPVGTVADMEVVLLYTEASGVLPPFHFTTDVLLNAVPVMTTTWLVLPAAMVAGARPLMAGALAMVSVEPAELTPSAVRTVIVADPAVARYEAGTVAEQEVLEQDPTATSGVFRPFHITEDPLVNAVPVTTSGPDIVLPMVTVAGARVVMTGAAAITNVLEPEVAPLGVCTVIMALPAAKRSDEGTVATREVALEYIEVSVDTTPPGTVVHFTMDASVKWFPVMVTDRPGLPAVAVAGEMLVLVGVAVTLNVKGAEMAPSGVTTVMLLLAAATRSAVGTVAVMEVALT